MAVIENYLERMLVIQVVNGQLAELEVDDETEVNIKSKFSQKQCDKFQQKADEKISKGKDIPKGLQKNLDQCEELPIIEIESPSFTLTVTATDEVGNTSTESVIPSFNDLKECDDDDDAKHDDDDDDDAKHDDDDEEDDDDDDE